MLLLLQSPEVGEEGDAYVVTRLYNVVVVVVESPEVGGEGYACLTDYVVTRWYNVVVVVEP